MSAWCNSCGKILTVDNSYQYEMLSGKKQIKKNIYFECMQALQNRSGKNQVQLG